MHRLPLTIAFFLFSLGLQSQNQASHCERLTELLQEGKYKSAYRLLVVNGEYSCGNYRYAEVLTWNGRYSEALEILRGQSSKEAMDLKAELEENLNLRKNDELYSLRSFEGNDSITQIIFAHLDAPILIQKKVKETSFFPRKTTEEIAILKSSGNESEYFATLKEEFSNRQETHKLDLSTGWISNDTLLYYSAYYQTPLYSAGFHNDFAIYVWDGKTHKLIDRIDEKGAYLHPTITDDGWLIFSSDRDGGFGGMDLWKINLDIETGDPINLGASVNSEYDEIYPTVAGDSLYLVTNDPERTIGGYDILLSYNGKTINPGEPLNSVSDELNPYTVNGDLAYMNTDRLYPDSLDLMMKVKPFKSRLLFDLIHGEISSNEINTGKKVELLDNDGNLLDYTYVNKDGRFTFANVKGVEEYTISFTESNMAKGDKVLLFDKDFSLMEELDVDESGKVRFELLTPEDYTLEKTVNKDESMLSVDIAGLLSSSVEGATKGIEIFLQDADGNTIARAFTNEKGEFIFEQVRPDEAYSFKSAVVDMSAEIRIFNEKGEVIESIKPGGNGDFVYIRLKETDRIITITNEDNIKVKVAEEEKFELPAIYFEPAKFQLGKGAGKVLDRLISILNDNPHVAVKLAGHTDSKGEAAYNLRLSQQRIESVEEYLIRSGIESNRITGQGFGETRLVNRCTDNVQCTEEEHAENRRIEIQFYANR